MGGQSFYEKGAIWGKRNVAYRNIKTDDGYGSYILFGHIFQATIEIETFPVVLTEAITVDRLSMLFGAISFIFIPSIVGILKV